MPSKIRIQKKTLDKIAKIITDIISPFTYGISTVIIFYLKFIPKTLELSLLWFLSTLLLLGTALLIIRTLIKSGHIDSWDITNRKKRPLLFIIFTIFIVIAWQVSHYLGFKAAAHYLMLASTGFATITFYTFFLKVSMHTFAPTLITLMMIDIYKEPWMVVLMILPAITGWTRIQLKKHTIFETVWGYLLAIGVYFGWCVAAMDPSLY